MRCVVKGEGASLFSLSWFHNPFKKKKTRILRMIRIRRSYGFILEILDILVHYSFLPD
jgi:hypothetical protein